ncbi:MAG: IS21 family transposase [Nitrospinae bacterium]|nr:IS21 family transposase [Nitrospinota bacterium]
MKLKQSGESLKLSSLKSGMSEKTARKYLRSGKLPSQSQKAHDWRTRPDPFEKVWDEIESRLELNPGLQSKTLFHDLQRRYPGDFPDGQLRTLQRRIKNWRALKGPCKEVYFPQVHQPGKLCQSDFCSLSKLNVTVQGQRLDHLLYHFVLTYSNWETGTICFSESFESLSEGLQNALWRLGGVPLEHQTDRLSAAVHKLGHPEEFTQRYRSLLSHYGLTGRKIQAGKANENGDVEQSHYRFKQALEQSLLLRGCRDFDSREEYADFIRSLFEQLNGNRRERIREELDKLKPLPSLRLNDCQRLKLRVGPSSTISVKHNVYSVHSRLIGERVEVRLYAERLEIWTGQKQVETLHRIRGESKHRVDYRHIIDWLSRKPGAFENYRYRDDLFPTSRFRMAYDYLKTRDPSRASREYLRILMLSAKETESGVDSALRTLIDKEQAISLSAVQVQLDSREPLVAVTEVKIDAIDLSAYDELLEFGEVAL